MDRDWNDSQPIYRQLRDRVVAMILDGVLNEGDPLPSVRNVAAEYRVNPLTVLKGYQQLVDEQLVEKKRGRGMFINAGARDSAAAGRARRNFSRKSGPRSTPRSSASASSPQTCCSARSRHPVRKRSAEHDRNTTAPASKRAACARRSARPSRWTASTCASRRAASSG